MLGRLLAVSAALWLLAAPAAPERVASATPTSPTADQPQQQRHISLPDVLDPTGVVGHIGETLGQAGRVLGLRIADTVADLVSSAFSHSPAKTHFPQPPWTRGDPGVAPVPMSGPYNQYNPPQQAAPMAATPSVLGGILRLLGLDSSKLGAIALNGVIFLAQLISSSFGARPGVATHGRSRGAASGATADGDAQQGAADEADVTAEEDLDEEPAGTPLSWILDNPAVKRVKVKIALGRILTFRLEELHPPTMADLRSAVVRSACKVKLHQSTSDEAGKEAERTWRTVDCWLWDLHIASQ
ncbi:uncharacterized protein LOC113203832 [Frankliniella occidentalis]|uniref:Uncharacterized protein LOC113203832 n=1 Tax=Frankliniella occidentalis TaxID=133901 RepID=A0A9C6XUG0_FRAOC|nr:uncharacterized protein LOC113203832 [Frankliniella occidentalis]